MELISILELAQTVRSRVLRVRTGLWLTPIHLMGQESGEAARLMAEAVNFQELWLAQLPKDTRFVGITGDKLLEVVDHVVQQTGGNDCALLYNFDLLLAKLTRSGRLQVWRALYGEMPHRNRALIIAMPAVAKDLLPDDDALTHWAQEKRLAG
jgi:hypothetical protein